MLLTIPNTFVNGTGPANVADADEVNANFQAGVTVLNGNIEKNNIKAGSAICLNDEAMSISAVYTFATNPVFNAGGIADAALSSNVVVKNASPAQIFTSKPVFDAGIDMNKKEIDNIVVEKVSSLPGWVSADKGRVLYNTTDGKFWGGGNADWEQLNYVGGYTGGAITRYSFFETLDDNNGIKLWFKTEGGSPTVKIALKGEAFPIRYYTELGEHNHTFSGIAHNHGIGDPGHIHATVMGSHGHGSSQYALNHYHVIDPHLHAKGSLAGSQPNHDHQYTPGTETPEQCGSGGNQAVTISGSVASGGTLISNQDSARQAIPSANLGSKNTSNVGTGISVNNATAGGNIANKGVNGGTLSTSMKAYGKNITVSIDGTNVTSDILTATGWSEIGNGLGSHAFHTTGTTEMDASAWKSYAAGFHILELLEPESGFGCRLMIHLETS